MTPSDPPSLPEKPKRRLWVLIPLLAFAASRLLFFKADAASENFPLTIGQSAINVTIDGHSDAVTNDELKNWITNSARGVASYFGNFPVPESRIQVRIGGGGRVSQGRTTPGREPLIRITVGGGASRADLDGDWVLVHEMVHLGFPDIDGPHEWMSEGIATYVEPLARLRNGTMTLEKYWADLVRSLPQGVPEAFDGGLNETQSWASTYWGGALFWFLADVQIRQTTSGKRGLEDCLRAMNREGGNFTRDWSLEDFFSTMDAEAGSPVFRNLYGQWALQRGQVDLKRLWARLGIVSNGRHGVAFDDTAPLASIRKALTGPTRK